MSTKFLSPGWRMPRNANQSKSSNYSLDFAPTDTISVSGFSTALSNVNNGTRSSDNNLPFSWSVWFRSRNSSNSYGEIAGYGQTQRNGIRIHNNVFRSNYTSDLAGTTTISQNVWYHGIVTYDGTTRRIYINGSLDASDTPSSAGISSNALTIGVYPGGTSYFNGDLNELCYFDYALSPSQVTTLWGGGTSVSNPMALPSPPIAYYPLGTSAWDGSFLAENNAIGDYVFNFTGNKTVGLQNLNLGFNSTISYWVKNTNNTGNYMTNNGGTLINTGPYAGNEYYTFKPNNSAPTPNSALLTNSNINTYILSTDWVHWTAVRNGTGYELYANGQSMATATVANWSGYDTIVSGLGQNSLGMQGDGSNFLFWNTNLSSTEVETLYNYGSPIQTLANIPQNSNLKAWYKLDASEVYNSSTTEWSIDNNQNPSAYASSLDFNGTNDYIDCGNPSIFTDLTSFSFSCWFNSNVKGNDDGILGKWLSGTNRSFALNLETSGAGSAIRFAVFNSSGAVVQSYINSSDWSTGSWYNVSGTYDGTNVKLYLDGVLKDTVALTGTVRNASQSFRIGVYGSSSYFDGEISNVQIFNTALTTTNVASLYNNGTPLSDMSSFTSLVSWYKLNNTTTGIQDSKGSNNGTNNGATEYPGFVNTLVGDSSAMTQANLVQSDLQTVAPYSKYAMNFDAADSDYINTNYNANLIGSSPQSFSMWFKSKSTGIQYKSLMGQYQENLLHGWGIEIGQPSNLDKITWYSRNSTIDRTSYGSALTQNQWYHLVVVINSASLNNVNYSIYLDGTPLVENATSSYYDNTSVLNSFKINNRYANSAYYGGGNFVISNASTWNTDLTSAQVTEIYNEGLPSNLNSHSAYSNLVSWWQLGENSSYTGDWIFADEKGSNNGDGQNMTEANLTNGVGTTANGVSSGMSEGNLVGDAPYSTANAISSGMSVVSRVTGSGNTP